MNVPDNLDMFNAHMERQEAALEKLPECSECNQPIQDDYCYEIDGELICPRCLKQNYRVETEDYMR